jgi:iron-sulfur cluster assembly protein
LLFIHAKWNFIIFAQKKTDMSDTKTSVELQPITLTDGAVKALRKIMAEQSVPEGHGLRVGVKGGGCSGFSYVLGFDLPQENDDTYDINGIRVFMQKSHAIYLLGMEIDWEDGLGNRGFSFKNPNATDTCGCGTSFSA